MATPNTTSRIDFDNAEIRSDLLHLVSRANAVLANSISRRAMQALNVTATQGRLLYLVDRYGLSHAGEIARECNVDPTAITRLIDRLVRIGFLTRARCLLDRRMIRLVLTPQGQAVADQMPAIFTDVYNEVLADFSPDEHALFKGMLRRLLAS
ncbi:DNA-binding MarR family transcriptional regulator [Paraburkholderia sp. GAS448]|uniref:MarR family winged helix-turn-helix transcriptional regulator n=1 Tax=Paraburkholderia sp. GAS448 TaxID=3035136 RepID=UPI003D2369FF